MALTTIITLLEKKIGLSANAIGAKTLVEAVQRRMDAWGLSDREAYLAYLQTSQEEWQNLVDAVVVTETWFFRTKESFTFLSKYIESEWLPKYRDKILRVLSIPCATGEEAYSIAITLLEAGLPEDRFRIDAVDISKQALRKARIGVYGEESFRNKDALEFRERFFEKTTRGYHVHASVKRVVRFMEGNLLDPQLLSDEQPYHVIFCRNLLIYYNLSARARALSIITCLLAKTGILFVGHAERSLFTNAEFVWFRQPGVFACQKADVARESKKPALVKSAEQAKGEQGVPEALSIVSGSKKKDVDRLQALKSREDIMSPPQKPREESTLPPLHIKFERRSSSKRSPGKTDSDSFTDRRKLPDENMKILDTARKLADQGSLEQALNLCKNVLSNDAVHVQTHFLTGLLYLAMRDDALAEEYFNKTVYLDPNHLEALNYLVFIAEQNGDQDKVRRLRQRAQRILQRESI